MLKTVEGIYQNGQIELTELPQDVSDWLRHRPKGDRTQVLVTFLVRQLIEQLETIAGIQQGFEELEHSQTRPVGDFIQEMQQKYDISG